MLPAINRGTLGKYASGLGMCKYLWTKFSVKSAEYLRTEGVYETVEFMETMKKFKDYENQII